MSTRDHAFAAWAVGRSQDGVLVQAVEQEDAYMIETKSFAGQVRNQREQVFEIDLGGNGACHFADGFQFARALFTLLVCQFQVGGAFGDARLQAGNQFAYLFGQAVEYLRKDGKLIGACRIDC